MIDPTEVPALAKGKRAIAIDGLPASGKSTLAEFLQAELGAVCLYLDDFVLPEALWPRPLVPGYPFPYIRHREFISAAISLSTERRCTLQPYDWQTDQLGPPQTRDAGDRPVIVEGVSALDPALAPYFDLRLWVESDLQTTLEAALARGAGPWARQWRDYFLPSVATYMASGPRERADHIVAGRGLVSR